MRICYNTKSEKLAMGMQKLKYLLILLIISAHALAATEKLPIPRFATIKSSEANARKGPGVQYPTTHVYQYKHLPVEVIAEYEKWRQVRDIKGDEGWIHSSILSGKRSVILISKSVETLHQNNNLKSKIVAKLMPNLICSLNKCIKSWCKIKCENHTGWISRAAIWGVYAHEF